jgi:purine nucleoside phosphorylase
MGWKDKVDNQNKINLLFEGVSINHSLFTNIRTNELYVLWDHDRIDDELKKFFKTLIRVLKISGVNSIQVLDECISIDDMPDSFVRITDHINFTDDNPLIGKNFEEIGPRFPDMSHAYFDGDLDRFGNLRQFVLAGVDDPDIPEEKIKLIHKSDAKVINFSVMWINILAAHASIEFAAVCKVNS